MLELRGVPLRGGAVIGIRGSAEASADAGEPVTTATGLVGMISRDGSAIDRVEVGMLGERHELIGALTAVENVAVRILAASAANGSSGKSRSSRASTTAAVDLEAIEQLLAALLLPPSSWHNLIEQLSGGQQQRVAVARALVGHPPLVCLDEPTTELDATSRDAVWRAIRNAAAEGSVVIVACSDPDELARCDEIWQL